MINTIDNVTREYSWVVVDTSNSGWRIVRELTCLVAEHGKPKMIVSDNSTQLTSNAALP